MELAEYGRFGPAIPATMVNYLMLKTLFKIAEACG